MQPTLQQHFAKMAELNNLAAAGAKPDDARVKAAQKDLREIDAKLYAARADMLKQMSDKGIPFMAGHGMRVGYGILPDHLADFVWRARLPFSVNILAEEAALAALNDKAFYDATQEAVRSGRKQLYTGLTALGCKVWPSQANFLMFGMPEGAPSAAECFETLLARGIIIRPLNSYGLPDLLRVSIGNQQENLAFLAAMRSRWYSCAAFFCFCSSLRCSRISSLCIFMDTIMPAKARPENSVFSTPNESPNVPDLL
jgi:Histidinol-phosphate/aromatic aminotransferase and cobyric acid decarboxylase